MSKKKDYWIQTYTGKKFSLVDPQPEDVCFEDIAVVLSREGRYGNHTIYPYTVAEHSVRVSYVGSVQGEYLGDAFAHDFAEYVTGDIPNPMKCLLNEVSGGAMSEIEDRIAAVVADVFGVRWPVTDAVHFADMTLLATEKRDLMLPEPASWMVLPKPLPERISPWGDQAGLYFRRRYYELKRLGAIR